MSGGNVVVTVSMADEQTGIFTGSIKTLPEDLLQQNTPPGCIAVPGRHDRMCRRLDTRSGQVVPYRPPAPAPDARYVWRWDTGAERWKAIPTSEAAANEARAERARLLAATDWLALRAIETGAPMPAAWAAYRQALRDLTAQPGWPGDITWPPRPE